MNRSLCSLIVLTLSFVFFLTHPAAVRADSRVPWWQFQSIDTMKYSRDPSREKLNDPSFDVVIDQQVADIADTGATHVAIATPYDEEFLPILKRWVAAARKYGLRVWFRGNWSGWEGWFNYPHINRDQHIQKTTAFITGHPDLFEDGDVFTGCPECENGGPGDPRRTRDVSGHREFLIREYKETTKAFASIEKTVLSNYESMNGDVARLIMDKNTTQALGGIVTIDHYVSSPDQLASDIRYLAKTSGGLIVLGEFGAPIPDIHGKMTDKEQADWIGRALSLLAPMPEVAGINYWVNVGGSTQLWSDETEKPAVDVLRSFYQPRDLPGRVLDENGAQVAGARVTSSDRTVKTDGDGVFRLPYLVKPSEVTVTSEKFLTKTVEVSSNTDSLLVTVNTEKFSLFNRVINLFKRLLSLKIFVGAK